jgi:HD-GYP domain-containing protein (c-di-GMP phosphodiesterase class II)
MTMITTTRTYTHRATDRAGAGAGAGAVELESSPHGGTLGLDRDGRIRDRQPLIRVRELEEEVRSLRGATICALSQLLDLKDLGTGFHSTRLAEWAVRLARALGLDEKAAHAVEVAALLHDVGKIGIQDAVLRKPGRLDGGEMDHMRRHPEFGWAILRLFPDLEEAALFVLHHHERIDGEGYPAGLEGEEIPLGARIIAVVDAFDAMVSNRSYRRGLPFEEAVRRLILASGSQFDSRVVDGFLRIARAEWPLVESSSLAAVRGDEELGTVRGLDLADDPDFVPDPDDDLDLDIEIEVDDEEDDEL